MPEEKNQEKSDIDEGCSKQEDPQEKCSIPDEGSGSSKESSDDGQDLAKKSFFHKGTGQKTKPGKDKMIKVRDSEYQGLINEAAGYKEKYVRLFAEFENVRKRFEREKFEFVKYANEGLITEFLGVIDDLERTVEAANAKHQDYDAFVKGIEMVMKQIHEMLKKNNVKTMESTGKAFDPHNHEILMQVETDEHDEGMVIGEFQKGYLLGDKVVRTAKVKVAVNPQTQENNEKPQESDAQQSQQQDSQPPQGDI